jgi:outer membrane immunogenic protein
VFPPGTLPGFPGFPGFPSSVAIADSNTAQLNGVIGGAQLGYNYQFNAKWVLGFEADIQGSGQRGSGTFNDSFSIPICVAAQIGTPPPSCVGTGPLSGTTGTEYDARIAWFGTVRGRFGYLITDQVLLYASGGLAYGQVKLSGNSVVNAALTIPPPFGGITVQFMPGGTAFSASKTNVGFSMGGGMEGRFSSWLPANWTWKLEYLYIDLGSLDAATSFASAFPGSGATPLSGPIATHTHFTDNIVRVGLNYKFDNYYTPIVAR